MDGSLRVAGTIGESIVDGPGLRYTIFTQGCPHACPGCHNTHTHDFEGGTTVQLDTLLQDILRNPLTKGVTFSGGEPFCQAAPLAQLAQALRAHGKHIMIYSGYTYEQLLQQDAHTQALLAQCDILVDGLYLEAQRDISLRFRGSRNQRVLQIPRSLEQGTPVWAEGFSPA